MKTEDIKNIARAWQQVQEKLTGNQHKIDHNKNGKIDAGDFEHMRSKKKKVGEDEEVEINPKMKIKKNTSQETMTTEGINKEAEQIDELKKSTLGSYIKGAQIDTADAADKVARSYDAYDKKQGEKDRKAGIARIIRRRMGTSGAVAKLTGTARVPATEETNEWPVYARIKEARDAHTKGATAPEAIDSKASKGEKDFKAMHKVDDKRGMEDQSHDDASKAGRVTKKAAGRNGDNPAGDKIQVPIDTTKG